MNQQIIWKSINHPDILPGYLISPQGYIKSKGTSDKYTITKPSYHSTNGYDFMLLNNKDMTLQLFPLDDIVAMAYIPIPESLKDKPIKVSHINGDTRDVSLDNLQWVEDIEEWKVCTYPGVKPDTYEVSSWGRVRNKKTGVIRVLCDNSRGYLGLKIVKQFKVHRMIAWEFLFDGKGFLKTVNHINGNKTKNYLKNLEIVTRGDNLKHAYMLELKQHMEGENHPTSKLTNSDAEHICQLLIKYKGWSIDVFDEMISEGYNVTKAIIDQILYKKTWTFISDQYFDENTFIKMRHDEVRLIRKTLSEYDGSIVKTLQLLKDIIPHLTYDKIQKIHLGITWTDVT